MSTEAEFTWASELALDSKLPSGRACQHGLSRNHQMSTAEITWASELALDSKLPSGRACQHEPS